MLKGLNRQAFAVALALALVAGGALAQAPDRAGQGRQGGRGGRGGAAYGERRPGMAAILTVNEILATEGANVVNTDNGVDVTVTAEGAEKVADLQARTTEAVNAVQGMVANAQDAAGDRVRQMPRRGLFGFLLSGDVTLTSANIDNGVVLSFTSDKPDVVEQLKTEMPNWIEQSRQRAQNIAVMQRQAQARELLADEGVKIETAAVDGGLTITITSTDPATIAKIQEIMKTYFEDVAAQGNFVRAMRARALERGQGGRGRGPAVPGEGRQRPEGRRGERRGRRHGADGPPDA